MRPYSHIHNPGSDCPEQEENYCIHAACGCFAKALDTIHAYREGRFPVTLIHVLVMLLDAAISPFLPYGQVLHYAAESGADKGIWFGNKAAMDSAVIGVPEAAL